MTFRVSGGDSVAFSSADTSSSRLGALVMAALLVGCHGKESGDPAKAFSVASAVVAVEPGGAVAFQTAVVDYGAPLPASPVTGRVTTGEALTSPVFAPLGGRVVETRVKIGDDVKKGERLVLVRTTELPEIERSKQAAELAIRTKLAILDRLTKLVEARAASKGDLAVAAAELDEAKLSASAATARLSALGVELAGADSFWLLAQRTGTVVQTDASPGREVGPGHDPPVATIADLAELIVVSDVPVRDAEVLEPGMAAHVTTPGSGLPPVDATVERISDVIDPERQTIPVRLRVPSRQAASADGAPTTSPAASASASAVAPDGTSHTEAPPAHHRASILRPNAYVRVEFERRAGKEVLLVPSVSVVTDGAEAVVFVEVKPGHYAKRKVALGRRTKDKAEIVSGVSKGEKVVTTGALLLLNAIDVEG